MLYRFGTPLDQVVHDGFSPDHYVYGCVEGDKPVTMAKSLGLTILELSSIFEQTKPDYVLTVADRYETLATAAAASYMNIPLIHTQGGEVTGSLDESVRHAITKLAHIHFPATQRSSDYLKRMGEDEEFICMSGCPALDLLDSIKDPLTIDILNKYGGVGKPIDLTQNYLVVLFHPVTTEYADAPQQTTELLNAMLEFSRANYQIIWLWPNIDSGSDGISKTLRKFREDNSDAPFHFFKNFSPEDYIRLLKSSSVLVGNSSSGIRECSYLGIPTVNIGSRQANREKAENVISCPAESTAIISAINDRLIHGSFPSSKLYGDGKAGQRMLDFILKTTPRIQKQLSYLNPNSFD